MADGVEITRANSDEKIYGKEKDGCRLSVLAALGFVFLAVALATGTGLLVYYAGDRVPNVTCHYNAGTDVNSIKSSLWKQCQAEVKDRNLCLTTNCPAESSTAEPAESTPKPSEVDKVNYRLPTALFPIHYDLGLKPNMYYEDPETFNFEGHVEILMNCSEETKNITLHIYQLEIDNKSLSLAKVESTETPIRILSYSLDPLRQFVIFHLDQTLQAGGQYRLAMNFTGPLKNDLKGLYRSSYQRQNQTVHMAVSMLAPTDARKVFPCFDEPALKATFSIVIVRKPPFVSISNMPVISNETRPDGFVADIFNTTEKMSTYLLAFIVCDFKSKENVTSGGSLVRVWATPEAVDQVDLALYIGVRVLEYYERYFQVKYPLPKLGMIAIPDFFIGGMENWGLITYRESNLLHDAASSTVRSRQKTATIVAHEIAHQWFGNLVTPTWWDDIWLNEGFASFVEYMGVNAVYPDWEMFEQFVYEDLYRAFSLDGLVTSHPIYQSAGHPDEINEIFDAITYAKGASVIRMLRYVIGEETFRKGLTQYLRSRAYEAAFHDDLYEALRKQAKSEGREIDVKRFMDTWTLQMNFPVVTVNRLNDTLVLRQERFLAGKGGANEDVNAPFRYNWEIPFTYTTSSARDFSHNEIHFMPRSGDVLRIQDASLPPEGAADWIIGNIQFYGYYRVNYDKRNWDALIRQLKTDHTAISTINRAQIISDAWSLAKASLVDQLTALQVVEYLEREEDYLPWVTAINELSAVGLLLSQSGTFGDFQKFMRRSVIPVYQKLENGNMAMSHVNMQLLGSIVGLACGYDVTSCVTTATDLFGSWMRANNTNPIPSWQRPTVYCTAIRYGSGDEWDFLYRAYKTSNVATEKETILTALACSRDTWILGRYLNLAMDEDEIRSQDTVQCIRAIADNPVGRYLTWRFLQLRWDELRERYGSGLFSFAKLVAGVTKSFNSQLDLNELETFMKNRPDQGTATRAFRQALERTRSNIEWLDKYEKLIADWLKSFLHS